MIDPGKRREQHPPLHIGGTAVEKVSTFKFLCIHVSEDLSWTHNITHLVRKSQQWLYFLRRLKFGMPGKILSSFYRCGIESLFTRSITVWFGSWTACDGSLKTVATPSITYSHFCHQEDTTEV